MQHFKSKYHIAKPPYPFLGILKVGDAVKVGISLPHNPQRINAEWIWVYVCEVSEDGKAVIGRFLNQPTAFDGKHGDYVHFTKADIYATDGECTLEDPFGENVTKH